MASKKLAMSASIVPVVSTNAFANNPFFRVFLGLHSKYANLYEFDYD